ncbi:Endonuclease-reverse transcriptase [Operophtera brumata]|uniref:Endonuclease-reverse transcriptase n=1 Tax=Operophtera brumata TaxID=104452 RepID=A0A0L7L7L2_OPEBR|nr:Endonuclease-reverse transcriptase [Operophtera brumata]
MEEVMTLLRKIQMELNEQKIMIQKCAENVTERTTENVNKILEEKLQILDGKYEQLKGRVEYQEKRLYFLEKEARQRNIVFYGIEESEKSYFDLETAIIDFIDNNFSKKLERRDVQAAKRLGKKGEDLIQYL